MLSSTFFSPLPILALVATTLLSSCSDSNSKASNAKNQASAPEFPFGGKVDSMNGIAGHTFGQPLSAFSDLEPMDKNVGDVMDTYIYRGTKGWFGKHKQEVPSQFYYFLDGKFCQFYAVGNAEALRTEASYLFGPGLEQSPNRFWDGPRARAVYSEQAVAFGREGRLTVISKPVEEELKAREQNRLKAENAE